MISVKKNFNEVPEILRSELAEKAIRQLLELKKVIERKENRYDIHQTVKQSLHEIYHGKCAYCESYIEVTTLNVEHYRPISKYYWLRYEWSHLLPLCNACHHARPAHFPIEGTPVDSPQQSRLEWHADSHSFLAEKPLLLNPEIDHPEQYLQFDTNGRIYPKDGLSTHQTKRAETTIQVFNQNRQPLVLARKAKIDFFLNNFKIQILNYLKNQEKGPLDHSIFKILFESAFTGLRQSAKPESDYSLLGLNMLDNFNAFFTDRISGEKNQQILTRAYEIFIKQSELLIKSASQSHFFNKRQSLPYAIKQIQIVNYKGIIKTGIAGIPEDTKWIFLTGENGFGKTNILQALLIGLYGERDGNTLLTEGDCQIGLEFLNRDHTQINNLNNPLEFESFTHFAAYGPSRLEIQTPLTKNISEDRSSLTYGLFNANGILLNIESELSRWYFKDKRRYEKIKQILLKLLPHIADLSVDSKTDEILYYEKEPSENGRVYDKPLTFNQLASGYQSLIAIVGDMLLRLIQQQQVNEIDELSGIVLIDEFDLHFHPKWQRELPNKLSALFPKIQFIASTHSIIPFLGAPKESVFLKVTRNKKEGVKLTRVDIDIQNLLPNAILTSPLFDFEQLIPDDYSRIRTEDSYDDIRLNDAITRKLKELAEREGDYPDDLFKMAKT